MFYRFVALTIISSCLLSSGAANALRCRALDVIGGQGTSARKTVSIPGTLATRNNWNTDFSIPGGARYRRFTAVVLPRDSGKYSVAVYLKYSDKSSDKFYDNSVSLTKGRALRIPATPRSNNQPYQVNVKVGSIDTVGKNYTVSVEACD